jgi:HAD superfamily hydrolase (TIGR01509 family)
MIEAVIYDMDGVLIDSEPLWRQAEVDAFKSAGVLITEEMCYQTTGLRVDEVVAYWYGKMPWVGVSQLELSDLILKNVIELIKKQGQAKSGVLNSLEFIKKQNVKLAIASSSPLVLIDAVIRKLGIENYFDAVHSAQFENHGKPHPDVYISTAKKLNINPQACLAIEDSVNGVISAKAAKMKCIAVPEHSQERDKRFGIADIIISSLSDIDDALLRKLT